MERGLLSHPVRRHHARQVDEHERYKRQLDNGFRGRQTRENGYQKRHLNNAGGAPQSPTKFGPRGETSPRGRQANELPLHPRAVGQNRGWELLRTDGRVTYVNWHTCEARTERSYENGYETLHGVNRGGSPRSPKGSPRSRPTRRDRSPGREQTRPIQRRRTELPGRQPTTPAAQLFQKPLPARRPTAPEYSRREDSAQQRPKRRAFYNTEERGRGRNSIDERGRGRNNVEERPRRRGEGYERRGVRAFESAKERSASLQETELSGFIPIPVPPRAEYFRKRVGEKNWRSRSQSPKRTPRQRWSTPQYERFPDHKRSRSMSPNRNRNRRTAPGSPGRPAAAVDEHRAGPGGHRPSFGREKERERARLNWTRIFDRAMPSPSQTYEDPPAPRHRMRSHGAERLRSRSNSPKRTHMQRPYRNHPNARPAQARAPQRRTESFPSVSRSRPARPSPVVQPRPSPIRPAVIKTTTINMQATRQGEISPRLLQEDSDLPSFVKEPDTPISEVAQEHRSMSQQSQEPPPVREEHRRRTMDKLKELSGSGPRTPSTIPTPERERAPRTPLQRPINAVLLSQQQQLRNNNTPPPRTPSQQPAFAPVPAPSTPIVTPSTPKIWGNTIDEESMIWSGEREISRLSRRDSQASNFIMERPDKPKEQVQTRNPQVGDVVAVRVYPSKEKWYRAYIRETNFDGTFDIESVNTLQDGTHSWVRKITHDRIRAVQSPVQGPAPPATAPQPQPTTGDTTPKTPQTISRLSCAPAAAEMQTATVGSTEPDDTRVESLTIGTDCEVRELETFVVDTCQLDSGKPKASPGVYYRSQPLTHAHCNEYVQNGNLVHGVVEDLHPKWLHCEDGRWLPIRIYEKQVLFPPGEELFEESSRPKKPVERRKRLDPIRGSDPNAVQGSSPSSMSDKPTNDGHMPKYHMDVEGVSAADLPRVENRSNYFHDPDMEPEEPEWQVVSENPAEHEREAGEHDAEMTPHSARHSSAAHTPRTPKDLIVRDIRDGRCMRCIRILGVLTGFALIVLTIISLAISHTRLLIEWYEGPLFLAFIGFIGAILFQRPCQSVRTKCRYVALGTSGLVLLFELSGAVMLFFYYASGDHLEGRYNSDVEAVEGEYNCCGFTARHSGCSADSNLCYEALEDAYTSFWYPSAMVVILMAFLQATGIVMECVVWDISDDYGLLDFDLEHGTKKLDT